MIFSPHIGGNLLYRTLSNNNNLQITASPVLLFLLFLKCIVFVYFLFHCFFLSGLGLFVLFTQIGTTMHCLCTYWWIILNITCIRVAYLSSVLWCPLRFRIMTMFGSSLPPVVCSRTHVLFTLFVFCFAHTGVKHILCCVFALFLFFFCTLCSQFL
jgi:hypothetical protein